MLQTLQQKTTFDRTTQALTLLNFASFWSLQWSKALRILPGKYPEKLTKKALVLGDTSEAPPEDKSDASRSEKAFM